MPTRRRDTAAGSDEFVPAAETAQTPTITRVEPMYYASIRLHLSTGEAVDLVAGGKSSNRENAEARDRLVAILRGLAAGDREPR